MSGWQAAFVVLLVLDGVQLAVAGAAVVHGLRRRGRGEHALATYSFRHAALLAAGALILAVPLALGAAGVLRPGVTVALVVGVEVVVWVVARSVLDRLHRAAHA